MKYEIIKDDRILSCYIDNVLPDLYSGETFYFRLVSRSKYVKTIKKDIDLKCFTVDNKKNIIKSIRQLECEIGTYLNLDNNSLVLYLSPNPRSYIGTIRKTILNFTKILGNYKGQDPVKMLYSYLRYNCSRKIYIDLDYDICNKDLIKEEILKYINKDSIKMIMPTKNGVHYLIELDKVDIINYKDWYEKMSGIQGYDFAGSNQGNKEDNMFPLPGCNQFGFVPYFDNI